MNGRFLGASLMVTHFAFDLMAGGGHLLVDGLLWGGAALGLFSFVRRIRREPQGG